MMTPTTTIMAITKATASSDEAAGTSGVATPGSTNLDFADDVATVSSTTTSTVTVVFASSTETLALPTTSE